MLIRGMLNGVLRDLKGNTIISFATSQKSLELANIEGRDLDINVTQHREKRTLSQNAYYWQLVARCASKLRISTSRFHNLVLREVAPPFVIDGRTAMQPIPDTDKAEQEVLESSTFHLKPTSGIIVGNDRNVYRWYIVLRGSSTFDTKEMTALLDFVIGECKELGIETLPPVELERMRKQAEEMERRRLEQSAERKEG